MLKQLVGSRQRQSFQGAYLSSLERGHQSFFRGHSCQAWSVAPCIFEWRGTQRRDGGWADREGAWKGRRRCGRREGSGSASKAECLPGSYPLPPARACPCMGAFPAQGQSSSPPDGGSVSPPWTAARSVPSGMSFLLLPLPTLSLSLCCLPEAGSWPLLSGGELCPLTTTSTKAPRRVP